MATYSASLLDLAPYIVGFVISNWFFGVVAVSIAVQPGPRAVALAALALAAWMDWWLLFRVNIRFDLFDGHVHWRSALGHGSMGLDQIKRIRPARFRPSYVVIEPAGGQSLLMPVYRGLDEFIGLIHEQRPDLPVQLSGLNRLQLRMSIWNRLTRRDR